VTEIIIGQVRFVLVTLCLGMLLMCGYDIWRLLRWVIPHHKVVIWVEDLLYWTMISIPAYAVFFLYNDGAVRWYGAFAVFLGGILYEKGISSPLRRFGRLYLEKPKKKIFQFFGKIRRHRFNKKRNKPDNGHT